ncbi:MAG TPA: diguanylate cyclase [Polyangiaceae bacterium]|nr:diguanylate cyclase [Polyangiaceae bacterium]
MSSPQSSGSSSAGVRLGADGERVSERLGLHRQLLSKLAHSQALTGQDIDSGYQQVTELMTTLLRVERGSVWRFDASGTQLECVDLFEWTPRRHTQGALITAEAVPAYFRALGQNRCIAAHDAAMDPATAEFTESYLVPQGIGAMLDAPIWVGGRMVGVVCHEHVGGPRRWQFEEELLAGTMADFVARVIEASDRLRAERTLGQYREHVDELTRVEQALRRSGENLRIVLGAAPVALVLTRLRDQHVVLANERCAALFEVPLAEVVGQRTRDYYVTPEERDQIIGTVIEKGQVDAVLVRLKKRSGKEFWAELSARIVELDGQRCSLVGIFDVTAQKDLEEQLRALATCDSLTGAANRRHFVEQAQRERERSLRSGTPLSLCLFDADHFKSINDHYGHVAGDHVLTAMAQAATAALRTTDLLGRLGGEEFAMLLPDTDLAGAMVVAERVRAGVAKSEVQSTEVREGGAPSAIRVTISIGVAELRGDETFEAMLKRADRALYAAKDLGRDRVQA